MRSTMRTSQTIANGPEPVEQTRLQALVPVNEALSSCLVSPWSSTPLVASKDHRIDRMPACSASDESHGLAVVMVDNDGRRQGSKGLSNVRLQHCRRNDLDLSFSLTAASFPCGWSYRSSQLCSEAFRPAYARCRAQNRHARLRAMLSRLSRSVDGVADVTCREYDNLLCSASHSHSAFGPAESTRHLSAVSALEEPTF